MNSCVEISKINLIHNIRELQKVIGEKVILSPAIKGNAYGHGLEICAQIMIDCGIKYLSVFSIDDLKRLRQINKQVNVLLLGYMPWEELDETCYTNTIFSIFNLEGLDNIGKISKKINKKVAIHVKLETGFNRFGIGEKEITKFLEILKKYPLLSLDGAYSHFANIEDTVDRAYGEFQVKVFNSLLAKIEKNGFKINLKHISNGASTILYPKSHFDLVRTGLITYGMWPSQELYKKIDVKPVLRWKSMVAQIKNINKGVYIGYGCTYKTVRKTKIVSIPVGYYDGYDRGLSNIAHVLINGQRAPIRGRICMNVIMADVTDIPNVEVKDEVVLLGKQGSDEITAEEIATWANTINYEVTTRINEKIPRILV